MRPDDHDPLNELARAWRAQPTPPSPPERSAAAEAAGAALPEDELFGALGRAWRELPVPSAPPARGDELDERTLAAVEWARAAWHALEVPALDPTLFERARPAANWARPRRLVRLVSSAAALLLAVLAIELAIQPGADRSSIDSPTVIAQGPGAVAEGVPEGDSSPVAGADGIDAVLTDAGIELRSGPVRLLLLAGGQPLEPAPGPVPVRATEAPVGPDGGLDPVQPTNATSSTES